MNPSAPAPCPCHGYAPAGDAAADDAAARASSSKMWAAVAAALFLGLVYFNRPEAPAPRARPARRSR